MDRTEPCKKCQAFDWYIRGNFSYCRPCHTESQKKYLQNKAQGSTDRQLLKPPSHSLGFIVSNGPDKVFCSKGHPLFGDNVRISSQRNGRNLRRCCRTCERNAKRVSYGLAPEGAPARLSELLDKD